MKLGVLSITAVLASFVTANPILDYFTHPELFSLAANFEGLISFGEKFDILGIIRVPENAQLDYFKFAWYGKATEEIKLIFTDGLVFHSIYAVTLPSTVRDERKNGYEMFVLRFLPLEISRLHCFRALREVRDSTDGVIKYYEVLLVNRAKTSLKGLESVSKFIYDSGRFYSEQEVDGRIIKDQRWFTCRWIDETGNEEQEEQEEVREVEKAGFIQQLYL